MRTTSDLQTLVLNSKCALSAMAADCANKSWNGEETECCEMEMLFLNEQLQTLMDYTLASQLSKNVLDFSVISDPINNSYYTTIKIGNFQISYAFATFTTLQSLINYVVAQINASSAGYGFTAYAVGTSVYLMTSDNSNINAVVTVSVDGFIFINEQHDNATNTNYTFRTTGTNYFLAYNPLDSLIWVSAGTKISFCSGLAEVSTTTYGHNYNLPIGYSASSKCMYVGTTNGFNNQSVDIIDANPLSGTYKTILSTQLVNIRVYWFKSNPVNNNMYLFGHDFTADWDKMYVFNKVNVLIATIQMPFHNTTAVYQPIEIDPVTGNVILLIYSQNQIFIFDGNPASGTYNTIISTINASAYTRFQSIIYMNGTFYLSCVSVATGLQVIANMNASGVFNVAGEITGGDLNNIEFLSPINGYLAVLDNGVNIDVYDVVHKTMIYNFVVNTQSDGLITVNNMLYTVVRGYSFVAVIGYVKFFQNIPSQYSLVTGAPPVCNTDTQIENVISNLDNGLALCSPCASAGASGSSGSTPPLQTYTIYYGRSSNAALDNTGVSALTAVLQPSFEGIFNYAALDGQYVYFAYPASIGTPSRFKELVSGLDVIMQAPYNVVISAVNYTIYRSFNIIGGSQTMQVIA